MALTCVACAQVFEDVASQRAHYKLEWHRANLKRKVAGLNPITNEEYERRKAAALEMQNRNKREEFHGECEACRKQFSGRQIMEDHMRSKKHKQKFKEWEKTQSARLKKAATESNAVAPSEDNLSQESQLPPPPPNQVSPTGLADAPNCPGNHGMVFGPAEEALGCDECGGCFGAGAPFFSCRECEHDVCGPCGGAGELPADSTTASAEDLKEEEELLKTVLQGTSGDEKKEHRGDSIKMETDSEEEGEDDEEEEEEEKLAPILPTCCLFCSWGTPKDESGKVITVTEEEEEDMADGPAPAAEALAGALAHMRAAHGFFLPDAEYLADPAGLLAYLQAKVKRGFLCLYCHKQTTSLQAAQSHMKSKGHCKLLYDAEVDAPEYAAFYDFTASYREAPAGLVVTEEEGEDTAMGDGEGDWIAGSAAADKAVKFARVFDTNDLGELVLLNGKTLGHRDFRRYYRQNLRPDDNRASVVAQARENRNRLLIQAGLVGEEEGSGGRTTQALIRLQNLAGKYEPAKEIKKKKMHYFLQNKQRMKVGVNQNRLHKPGLQIKDM